jgi:hypothetical protein
LRWVNLPLSPDLERSRYWTQSKSGHRYFQISTQDGLEPTRPP